MKVSKEFILAKLKTLFFCLLGAIVMTYFTCISCRTIAMNYIQISLVSTTVWFAMWVGNDLLAEYTSKKISWTEFPIRRLIVGVVGTAVYSIAAVVLLTAFWNALFQFSYGNYYEPIIYTLILTFTISLVIHSRAFLIHWKATTIEAEKFKRESIQAKYESLKNQVNPHFLFNSLNALTNLVYEDQDKAAKFIKQLAEVYRYVLDTRDKEVVSLDEEIKFIDSYLFLQKIRFGDKLKVNIELNGASANVAPLALQMLVENAIKHNVIAEDDPLTIRIYIDQLFLVVENNLNKKSVLLEESPGLGLDNIRKRYEFLSREKVIVDSSGGKFVVKLPILPLTE